MKNEVKYEWCYETVVDGEIVDNDHEDRLVDFQDDRKTDTLCLVRDVGNEDDGLQERMWAYVENGVLPEFFSNAQGRSTGVRVPEKFHDELSKNASINM